MSLLRRLVLGPVMAVLLTLMACADMLAPFQHEQPLVDGAVRFDAPAVYLTWWKETEQCSGVRRRMGDMDWYRVPDAWMFNYDTLTQLTGLFQSPHRITLSDVAREVPKTVRHEMLHAILRVGNHPRAYFGVKCKGLVDYDSTRP